MPLVAEEMPRMPALQQRRHLSCVCLVEPALGSGARLAGCRFELVLRAEVRAGWCIFVMHS